MKLIYNPEDVFVLEAEFSINKDDNGLCSIGAPKENNSHKLKFLAKGPMFSVVSSALEEATYINHITGEPFVRSSLLYRELFPRVIVNISFDNNEFENIDVSSTPIDVINFNLVKLVCKTWMKNVL